MHKGLNNCGKLIFRLYLASLKISTSQRLNLLELFIKFILDIDGFDLKWKQY